MWFKDAIIYELHVRAFADSDADGIGDFRGLTSKLDYLADLGVTALWLLPFYPSPLRDDGYDIADYDTVNPMYGTTRDFQRFVSEAHARDLKVITELVINHTSDQHPWFRRAVKAAPGSPERDFYVWSDKPDKYEEARIIFQDFEGSNWSWHPEAEAHYWHRFYHHQPDLNFDNPAVRTAVKDALDHWMAMGVDGLRLDAIPYLYEREGTNCENLPETHEFLKELRSHLDDKWDNRLFLAEANQWPEDAAAYFGDGDECHMNFHFPLMPRLYMAVAMEDRFPILDILAQTPEIPDNTQWALFLRNHDELTLEMVTDEERDYMRRTYASDPRMRINLGIRRRLAPLLNNDRRLIELLNVLLFTMPGTPVLYYGDEIGMGDNVWLGDRDGVRTPMQWNGDRNAGFSRANPQSLFLPTIIDPEYHYETVNVEAQQSNPRSLWWWMKRSIGLRRQHDVFGRGDITFLPVDNPKILAFIRSHEDTDVLVVANLSRYAQACELDLSDHAGSIPVEMFGSTPFPPIGDWPYYLTPGPYGYYWFELVRDPASTDRSYPGGSTLPVPEADATPVLTTTLHGTDLVRGEHFGSITRRLEEVLAGQRWFAGKSRTIRRVSVLDHATVVAAGGDAALVLVEVEFTTGDPDVYAMTVAFASGEEAHRISNESPGAVLLDVRARTDDAVDGVLYDGLWDPTVAHRLLDGIRRGRTVETRHGELSTWRSDRHPLPATSADLPVTPLGAEQSNTSVVFGSDYVLKLVRRPEEGVNPDLEVTRFLSERTDFANVPPVVGAIEHRTGRRAEPRAVAILQGFVPNEGDAWRQALSAADRWLDESWPTEVTSTRRNLAPMALARRAFPEAVEDSIGPYLQLCRQLGSTTAAMHAALASDSEDPDFAPEGFTALYQRSVYQAMRTRTRRTMQLLERVVRRVGDDDEREGPRPSLSGLLDRSDDVLDRFTHLKADRLSGARTRIHGDYHLGQVLWTGKDYVVLDFEGEPARSLSERRLKYSPLRDVAGMLRSYHYAAHIRTRDLLERGAVSDDEVARLDTAATWWGSWTGAAFLAGYLADAPADVLPDTRDETARLLDAYVLEKTLYELEYELNNRIDWVDIPLVGILDQLDASW
nr:maltose alpha-D-glucosyltransferase [Salsipaludibacter albus]